MTKTTNNQQQTLFKTKPNKAKVKIGKMSISVAGKKGYGKKAKIHDERYSKQTQTKPRDRKRTKIPYLHQANKTLIFAQKEDL